MRKQTNFTFQIANIQTWFKQSIDTNGLIRRVVDAICLTPVSRGHATLKKFREMAKFRWSFTDTKTPL